MRARPPGELVIEQLLELQGGARPRSGIARFLGSSPLTEDNLSWYLGALGEIAVGRVLAALPAEWTVFHALPVGKRDSDIDHVVVGPAGVFVINTKHHNNKPVWIAGGTFMASGHSKPHLRNSAFDADRVERLLSERGLASPVVPMIVLVDPKSITIKRAPKRVQVVDARRLTRWLTRRAAVLSPEVVLDVVAVLDDPANWRVATASDPELLVRFARLDREVRAARGRRMLWVAALTAAMFAGIFALVQYTPELTAGYIELLTP